MSLSRPSHQILNSLSNLHNLVLVHSLYDNENNNYNEEKAQLLSTFFLLTLTRLYVGCIIRQFLVHSL